ncbi:MAG TPA: LysM peptidoglycan-binding domain-containing protein [Ilumatobacteraceae bacterium]|nr:LysM peptidoglycan-binding domain-containing protein [Ilumatobacteraceae bacterium]HRB02475.1 LysM peptidoglycan-binding domain-containing protein [Ilumatobacteraceae bacterium]
MAAALNSYTVVLPARLSRGHAAGPARRVDNRPSTQVFVRRRVLVAVVFSAVFVALTIGAGSVLANRGGAPASIPAVRSASTYVVQPGDTVWSIADQLRGGASQVDYVDALVATLGSASLQVGQLITLP